MRSKTTRIAVAVGAIAALAALFVVLSSGGDENDDKPSATTPAQGTTPRGATPNGARPKAPVPVIRVRGGQPVGGVQELSHEKGERVRFRVRSDVADEVHVHGYDVIRDVPAGGSVSFSFPATIEGVFEIELESRHVQIAELRVRPG